ncbi:alanine dehydrogenase [Actinoalloteichus sp. AHMU CJ021]|uniref:alanine dehydrogenase n=1 Tax=Actinoalloteichus TaxID=65496 RepID=UPI000418388B|nr:alanine dehydrogenase [Actinoalloteichus caeruleus]AUS77661.1 alanine dehydrogenase [Actinoalloteichus sp. AHMU CJ021]
MRVGVPRELREGEHRVALAPSGVVELTRRGHQVLVESGAGAGSAFPDTDYLAAGAQVLAGAEEVWERADLVLKVKAPGPAEYPWLRRGQTLFAFLHLAAEPDLTSALVEAGTTAVGYETVRAADGSLPLLSPMSEVAGRMAAQVGAHCLERAQGGRGVLLGGVRGVPAGKVAILGGGVVGTNAALIALGLQAEVMVLDSDPARLRYLDLVHRGRLRTVASNAYEVERACLWADLVIGSALVPGAPTPRLVGADLVERMRPGSVLVDVSIDQGGCFEQSRPTTHAQPTFRAADSVFYCVPNIPSAVPHTSTWALTNATLPYVAALADRGAAEAARSTPALAAGLQVLAGTLLRPEVGRAHGIPHGSGEEVLG